MLEVTPVRSLTTVRRDVYRLVLALTRMVIDPLVAGQVAGALYQDQSTNVLNQNEQRP
jgi:hypothetical protein